MGFIAWIKGLWKKVTLDSWRTKLTGVIIALIIILIGVSIEVAYDIYESKKNRHLLKRLVRDGTLDEDDTRQLRDNAGGVL
jgi:hypothetical protein